MTPALPPLPGYPVCDGPVVLCILDGVGEGRRDDGDAVFTAHTPALDLLRAERPWRLLQAHGTAVGMPSDEDMGNSEVGHNAMGAGRVFQQGAALVEDALASGQAFGETWRWLAGSGTLHLLGLVSDGNVHSHIEHLLALIKRARADGVRRLRVHVLTDGRDVEERSAPRFIERLEAALAGPEDYAIASGGGRMHLTMDRYEADWGMVARGWACHVDGQGRAFPSALEAVRQLYAEDPQLTDQHLPAFVIEGVEGRIQDGDGVLLFNFRGDRALEICRAFEGRPVGFERARQPAVRFAGMMQYDGDEKIPRRYLVEPPAIDRTVGEFLVAAGARSLAISETQKFGHVTFFFNGNRSGRLDERLERYTELPSETLPFEQAPAMRAEAITDEVVTAIASGGLQHIRLNLANGDMVGHTGDFDATVKAMEVVDHCVGRLVDAVQTHGGVLLVTADHGNADQMYQVDKKTGRYQEADGQRVPRTSHSLNPVPFILVDPAGRWELSPLPQAGLANIGATVLALCGLQPPPDYLPSLVQPRRP